MPRGIPAVESGRLNARQARELAKEVELARPDLSADVFKVAQGLAVVEVRAKAPPRDVVAKLSSRQAWEAWRAVNANGGS